MDPTSPLQPPEPRAPGTPFGPPQVTPTGSDPTAATQPYATPHAQPLFSPTDPTSCWTGPPMNDAAPSDDTPGDSTSRDRTDPQPAGTVPARRRRRLPRFVDDEAFQTLRGHLNSAGLALLVAVPVALLAFVALGGVRAAADSRTFWNSIVHSLVQFPYVMVFFVLVLFPPALVAVRRGWREAQIFTLDRGYWKLLVAAFVVIPVLAAIVAFVVGHVVLVLVILGVLFVLLLFNGGF